MKNENIDKKNKGLKIGIVALSIFSTILLIFNLLLCATFKDKDLMIKTLENDVCPFNSSPKNKVDTITNFDNYVLRYTGGTNTSFNQSNIKTHFGTSSSNVNYSLTGKLSYVKSDNTEIFDNVDFTTFRYSYSSYRCSIDIRSTTWILSISVASSSYSVTYYPNLDGTSVSDNSFTSGSYFELSNLGGTAISDTNISWFLNTYFTATYVEPEPDTPITYGGEYVDIIDFSKTNPLIYFTNNLYNNGAMISTPTNNTIYITGVEFVANGFLFNRLTIRTLSLGGINITTDNLVINDDLSNAYAKYSCFYSLNYDYVSEERNYSIYVCGVGFHYLPHSSASSSFALAVNPLEKTWLNEEYKTLSIVSTSDDLCSVPAYNNLTGYELLKLQSDFTSSTLGDTNIFSLLGGAFSALASILSIRIIPGISIGLLIFIPLVVSIIIAIIKLIGK